MEEVKVVDAASLNTEFLQLQDLPSLALKDNPYILDRLFSHWLSLPPTILLVKSLIEKAKNSAAANLTANSSNGNANAATNTSSLPCMFVGVSVPPLSPRSVSSPRLMRRASSLGPSHLSSPLRVVSQPVRQVIPQFYFQNGRPPPYELKKQCMAGIDQLFAGHADGLRIREFRIVTKEICNLPSFFATILFGKIDTNNTEFVTRDAFVDFWVNSNMMSMDISTQIFTILKQPNRKYLTQEDFKPVLLDLLASHPGLEFLQSTPEFQERYAETVIYRIFYCMNRTGTGRLTLRELKRGNLIDSMQHADEEEDINKVLRWLFETEVLMV